MTSESGSGSELKPTEGKNESGTEPSSASSPTSQEKDSYIEEVILPPNTPPEIAGPIIEAEKSSSRRGQIIGLMLCIAGIILAVLGFNSNVTWKLVGGGISNSVQTGSIGVVVLIAGVIVILYYRLKITIRKLRDLQKLWLIEKSLW
jgi:hypothetical protein